MILNGYKELEALPAEAYLDWERFQTPNDALPPTAYAEEQYQKGLDVGRRAKAVHISVNSVWSAQMPEGGSMQSYEGIGYHSCTSQLLRGFLASGCAIVVHRWSDTGVASTEIKGRAVEHAEEVAA